jgi:hypothetical protein
LALLERFSGEQIEPHIKYASLEHFKQMARVALGRRFDAKGDQTASYQEELFTGQLQERYPVPRQKGEEPMYKHLKMLNTDELRWNADMLRKSAVARQEHADALIAYADAKFGKPATSKRA